MSHQEDKDKRSSRLYKEKVAIARQSKIAKRHGVDPMEIQREPGRFAKKHAMDCGNPECGLCGNPRHIHKHGKTKQEYSFEETQDWIEE